MKGFGPNHLADLYAWDPCHGSLFNHESDNDVRVRIFINRVPGIITIIITILAYPSSLSNATATWFWTVSPCGPICPTFCCPIITNILVANFHISFRTITKRGCTRTTSSFSHADTIETWSITVWPLTPFLPFTRTWLKYRMIVKQVFIKLKVIIDGQRISISTVGKCENANVRLKWVSIRQNKIIQQISRFKWLETLLGSKTKEPCDKIFPEIILRMFP